MSIKRCFTVELLILSNMCYPTTVDCTSGMSHLTCSCSDTVTVNHIFLLSSLGVICLIYVNSLLLWKGLHVGTVNFTTFA